MKRQMALGGLWMVLLLWLVHGWTHTDASDCLHVGEPPRRTIPQQSFPSAGLEQEWAASRAILPGHLLGLFTWHKTHPDQRVLVVQVNGEGLDPQETPQLFADALLILGERMFHKGPEYNTIELKVFRQQLWVYGAKVHRVPAGHLELFVQQDWRCLEEATTLHPI